MQTILRFFKIRPERIRPVYLIPLGLKLFYSAFAIYFLILYFLFTNGNTQLLIIFASLLLITVPFNIRPLMIFSKLKKYPP
jgi:hypothetical protein